MSLRTEEEIELMIGRAMTIDGPEWSEAVALTLEWVLGNDDDPLAPAIAE